MQFYERSLLFGFAVKAGWLNELLTLNSSSETENVISLVTDPNKPFARQLEWTIAALIIIAIGGTAITELDYATSFLMPVFMSNLDPATQSGAIATASMTIHFSILAFTVVYVLWGGYRAVVATDRIQVPWSVCLLCGLTVALFYCNWLSTELPVPVILLMLSAISFIGVAGARVWIGSLSNTPKFDTVFWFMCLFLIAIAFLTCCLLFFQNRITFEVYSNSTASSFAGFGLLGIISLTLANGLWQFVDLSSLQRLQSLEFVANSSETQVRQSAIAKSLVASGIESSSLWILATVVGILFATFGLDSTDLPIAFAAFGPFATYVLMPALLFVIVSFAISTIDAFLSAMAFTMFVNVTAGGKEKEGSLNNARWATLVSIGLVYLGYAIAKVVIENNMPDSQSVIAQILYAIYAIQLACAPLFLGKFIFGVSNNWGGILSIIAGFGVACFSALIPPLFEIDQNSWQVIPPLISLGMATIVYAPFFLFDFVNKSNQSRKNND